MELSRPLIHWYLKNHRDLPWRNTKDPYYIWLSEVILQQTRVDQGLDYYFAFTSKYPTIGFLSKAKEEEILKLWQGLGYYSRARNLLKTAKYIQNELEGKFPVTYEGLLKLAGIGPYTAAAIASFAFGKAHAVVDGNVMRVISRLFDISDAINTNSGRKKIEEIAGEILDKDRPDLHNQAIMELGALICTPQKTKCAVCPLADNCMALNNGTVEERPVKIKSKKVRSRNMDYAVLESKDSLVFRKRGDKDIWRGLYDFAALENVSEPAAGDLINHLVENFPQIEIEFAPSSPEREYTHVLSHQKITARFWRFRINGDIPDNSVYLNIPKERIEDLAIPRLIHRYLEDEEFI